MHGQTTLIWVTGRQSS